MGLGAAITALVAKWGLPLIVMLAFVEGDSLAMIAGSFVHRHVLPLIPTLGAVWLGAFASDQFWFQIGRRASRWPWAARQMERPAVLRLRDRLAQHEMGLMVSFRFLYGLRVPVPLLLGHSGVSSLRFMAVDAVAVLVWAGGLIAVGAGLGAAIHAVFGRLPPLPHYGLVIVGALVVVAIAAFVTRHVRRTMRT